MPLSPQENAKIAKYEELLANEPNTLVFAALGSLYARQYNFERAVEILDGGLQYFPNYFSARVLLAKCYLALNLFDAAIAELEKVIDVDPNNVSALALLGDEYRNRGKTEKARAFYERVLELDPNNEEFQYKLHLIEETTRGPGGVSRTGDAALIEAASEPIAGDESSVPDATTTELATVTLARIYIDQGLLSKAGDILDIIIQRDPNNREAAGLREQLGLASAEGKIAAPAAQKIAAQLEKIERIIEDDEFDIDLANILREASANLKEAFIPVFIPRPNGCTSGDKSYELFDVPKPGEGGGDNLVLDDSLAEIYMVEFQLPEVRVLAGELGIDEIILAEQLAVEEDEFVIDTGGFLPKRTRLSAEEVNKIAAVNSDSAQNDIEDGAGVSNIVIPDEERTTYKLQPEDILIYKPDGLDFDEETETANDKIKPENDSGDEIGKQYFEDDTKLLALEDNPFEDENEDFLGWLNSIKLKEI